MCSVGGDIRDQSRSLPGTGVWVSWQVHAAGDWGQLPGQWSRSAIGQEGSGATRWGGSRAAMATVGHRGYSGPVQLWGGSGATLTG